MSDLNRKYWYEPHPDYHINKRWGVGTGKATNRDEYGRPVQRRSEAAAARRSIRRAAKLAGVPLKQYIEN